MDIKGQALQGFTHWEQLVYIWIINTLRPWQNCRHSADNIFKCILLNENVWIWLKISLKFVPKVQINNIPPLVQIMAWRPPGDKPLSEPMVVSLLTHICVTRPQWLKLSNNWLIDTKPLSEPIKTYCKVDPQIQNYWNLNQNTSYFILKVDYKMPASLFRPQIFNTDALNFSEKTSKCICIFYNFLKHKAQVTEILQEGWQAPGNLTQSVLCLLKTWWCQEPGHQQPWYFCGMCRLQHQQGYP